MSGGNFSRRLPIKSRLMKMLIAVAIAFFHLVLSADAQEAFIVHGSKVVYQRPDPAQWQLVHNGIEAKSKAYLLMFKHIPIKDAQGRDIEPVIAVICEVVPNSPDVTNYSSARRARTPFEVKKVLTPQEGYFSYQTAVGYQGEYKRGTVLHKVVVGYLRYRDLGVQILCDSTDSVYNKVQADMLRLLRSIDFKE